jgi:hypothetical protein
MTDAQLDKIIKEYGFRILDSDNIGTTVKCWELAERRYSIEAIARATRLNTWQVYYRLRFRGIKLKECRNGTTEKARRDMQVSIDIDEHRKELKKVLKERSAK